MKVKRINLGTFIYPFALISTGVVYYLFESAWSVYALLGMSLVLSWALTKTQNDYLDLIDRHGEVLEELVGAAEEIMQYRSGIKKTYKDETP